MTIAAGKLVQWTANDLNLTASEVVLGLSVESVLMGALGAASLDADASVLPVDMVGLAGLLFGNGSRNLRRAFCWAASTAT